MSRLIPLLLLLLAGPVRAAGVSEPLDAAIRGQQLGVLLLAGGAVALAGGLGVSEASLPPPGADYSHPLEQQPALRPGQAVGGSMVGLGLLSVATGATVLGVYGLDGARSLRHEGRHHPRWPGRAAVALLVAAPVGYLATGPLAPDMPEQLRRELALGAFGGGVALGGIQLGANLVGRRSFERAVRLVPRGAGLAVQASF